MSNTAPSIIEILARDFILSPEKVRFLKPGPDEIKLLLTENTESSPASPYLPVRSITIDMDRLCLLDSNMTRVAVPFHRHPLRALGTGSDSPKHKLYIGIQGTFQVIIAGPDGICTVYTGGPGKPIAVPAGYWHSMVFYEYAEIVVVLSVADDVSVEWEPFATTIAAS